MTVVDICNLALGKLGDRANLTSIDPPEGSAQADNCARFYPIARDEALEAADWGWASIYVTMAQLDYEHPVWLFTYTLPADCLVVRELRYQNGNIFMFDPSSPQFEMSTMPDGRKVLLTNTDLAYLRYTRRVVDTTRYSPTFTTALVFLLASHLAGPVIKGKAGVQTSSAMYTGYREMIGKADVIDANQSRKSAAFTPSAMRARGYGGQDIIVEQGQERFSLPFWAQ